MVATNIAFPTSPQRILKKIMKKTKPYLSLGTIGHGPTFNSFVIPKVALNTDDEKVAKKKGSE